MEINLPAAPARPCTALEIIQMHAKQVTNESLDSTRRMLAMCDESKEAGIRTLVALDEQGEQIDHVEEGMSMIHTNVREAEKNLTGMEKCCCGICGKGPCKKFLKLKKDSNNWMPSEDGKVICDQPARVVDERTKCGGPHDIAYITKITKDSQEREMEDNMAGVATMIGTLRNMAIDVGCEINSQVNQLDRIKQMTDCNEKRIHGAQERAQKLLK